MYLTPDEYWKRLSSLFPNGGQVFTDFLLARHRYPDLIVFTQGPGGPIFSSKSVNEYCTHVEFVPDGKLVMAFPYIEENDMRIYANPCVIVVGWLNPDGFGIVATEHILEEMAMDSMSEESIDLVEDYLQSHPKIDW